MYRVHPDGTFDPLDLQPSFGDLGDLVNGPEQTWFFSDFGKDQVYRLERTSAQPAPLITSGDIPRGLLDLAWHETAGKLYALNVAGNFPFGGLSAVYAVERGQATLVRQAAEGVPFVGMDASPGGPLGQHLFVLDSRGKLARLNERAQLITVLRGLNDFRHIRFTSQGDLYCIGGTDNRFVLRIERSPFDCSPVPRSFDLTLRPAITTLPPTQPEPPPPAQRAKAYVGIDTTDVNTPEARALGVTARQGAVIHRVYPDSPAAAAGLRAGHVIIGCAGREIRTQGELTAVFQEGRPGQKYILDVQSGQAFLNYQLTLGVWPEKFASSTAAATQPPVPVVTLTKQQVELPALGMRVHSAGTKPAHDVGIETPIGGVVIVVQAGSSGALAGLRRADVVVQFAGREISNYEDFEAATLDCQPGSRQRIVFIRGNQRYAADMILGRRTGELLIYTHPARAYRLQIPATWTEVLPTQGVPRPSDVFRSWDGNYTLECFHTARNAPSTTEALEAFTRRVLRNERAAVQRLQLGLSDAAFVSRTEGTDRRYVVYDIGMVASGRLVQFRVQAPVLSDPDTLPYAILRILTEWKPAF